MVKVFSAWCSVLGLGGVLLLSGFCPGCGEGEQENKVEIPPPPFTINLIPGYTIVPEVTMVGTTYYFQSEDRMHAADAGGIYFGALPDTSSPDLEYTVRNYRDVFMGDSADWREFTTPAYQQREVYIVKGPDQKIHCWYYSTDPEMLEELGAMIKSIRPK